MEFADEGHVLSAQWAIQPTSLIAVSCSVGKAKVTTWPVAEWYT